MRTFYEIPLNLPNCNAFVCEWPPGTGLDYHDHGDSTATIHVLQGHIANDTNKFWAPNHFYSGDIITIQPHQQHRIRNLSTRTATTLHIYMPPLTETYDESLEIR